MKNKWLRDALLDRGDRLVVSVSGGKDSTSICLWLMEQGLKPDDYDRVFADTGWELPSVYEYVRGPLTERVGPITEVRHEQPKPFEPDVEALAQKYEARLGVEHSSMIRLVLQHAGFPSRLMRFCTRSLKIAPIAAWLKSRDFEPVCVVGIRAQESSRRAEMPEWEWSDTHDAYVWRPIIGWTFQDVIDIHKRNNMRPAAPYFAGADRVGCAPCIFARKSELKWLADVHPDRMSLLGDLERDVSALKRARNLSKGKDPPKYPATWFFNKQPPMRDGKIASDTHGYVPVWNIEQVIEWAKGSVNQVELFAGRKTDHGCMRWGFCDTSNQK